jgi:hypothetical protein
VHQLSGLRKRNFRIRESLLQLLNALNKASDGEEGSERKKEREHEFCKNAVLSGRAPADRYERLSRFALA